MARRLGAVLAVVLMVIGLTACGGGGRHHHHGHGKGHGHHGSGSSGSGTPDEVVGTPTFAPVFPQRPGLHEAAVDTAAPTTTLTPPSTGADASGQKEFSRKITEAAANAVVHLGPGRYPPIYDKVQRSTWVTVSGEGDATPPVIDGAQLAGATHVRFVDVKFSGRVKITKLTAGNGGQHARNIQILNSDLDCGASGTQPGHVAINVRGASQDVMLSGDHIHDCVVGFTSAAQDNYSKNITITHCQFDTIYGDAIDLGGVDGMEITNNVIREVHRSHGFHNHDDGIQFFGNDANVVIAYNVEANSTDQLIFIQDATKNQFNGERTNQDILVMGNLIYGAGAAAVQDQGGVDVQFIGNTIWFNHDGAMIIRRSPYTHTEPIHTLVADNVIQGLALRHVSHIVQGYNVFGMAGKTQASTDLLAREPGFTNGPAGIFAIAAGSPAARPPAPPVTLVAMAKRAGASAAALKLIGAYRAPSRGANIATRFPKSQGIPRAPH